MTSYEALVVRVPASEVEQAVAELWNLGTVGIEEQSEDGEIVLRAYFPAGRVRSADWRLAESRWGTSAPVSVEPLADRDWLEHYRREAKPFPVGKTLWIDSGEPVATEANAPAGRSLLRLPARTAFGTGSHESTRLAVELLESLNLTGRTVLDVGTGSGILALAAVGLGAARVVALEVDPAAAMVALQNQRLNNRNFELIAGRIAGVSSAATFDIVLANVLPERIEADLPAIASRLTPTGIAVFSGILAERAGAYEEILRSCGLHRGTTRVAGDWCAWLATLAGSPR